MICMIQTFRFVHKHIMCCRDIKSGVDVRGKLSHRSPSKRTAATCHIIACIGCVHRYGSSASPVVPTLHVSDVTISTYLMLIPGLRAPSIDLPCEKFQPENALRHACESHIFMQQSNTITIL